MTQRDQELLAEWLLLWEELHEKGQDTPATELAKERPDLVAELDRRISVIRSTSWLDRPLGNDDPPPSNPSTNPAPLLRILGGRYRLDELIAEGGFAQVLRAYDRELQRTVAVKIPKANRLESTDVFLAEARRVARLKHPNMVQVYDVGVDGPTCFIVSEYIEGGSLAGRLTQGSPSRDQVCRWVSDVADALEYAHLNGVIHRDIKPANILIDHHGRALLADFGIAQSATKTGRFDPSLGTLRYMSPEQLRGAGADHRSDIYSLAVVLYEALAGHVPYSSNEPNVIRKEIVLGASLSATNIPAGLLRVCRKALSKSPHQRHASAAQFAADLRMATAPRRMLGRTSIWLLLGTATVLLGAYRFAQREVLVGAPADSPASTAALPLPITWPDFPPLMIEASTTNSVGMTLALVPAGSFVMGSPSSELGRDADEKQVKVTITKPFWIGTTEVTLRQWQAVMKGHDYPVEEKSGDCAVSNVTWEHAVLFCEWLTKQEREAGAISAESLYRLPTEAEWEYACRCGRPGAFCFGDDLKDLGEHGWWGCEVAIGSAARQCYSHPVGSKKPNVWGLFDMHGNLWEWCQDYDGPGRVGGDDPVGPDYGKTRVLKGGSFKGDQTAELRSANRHSEPQVHHWPYFGFRVVRVGE